MAHPVDVTIVGGGMITNDLLLPSLYHLQRTGLVDEISICALNTAPLKALKENEEFLQAFPGHSFTPYPSLETDPATEYPQLFKEIIAAMKPRQAVVIALPDHLHYDAVKEALKHNQHVLCVKPLVLKYEESVEIEELARDKGLFVGVEYHKRFDRRSLVARRHYQSGHFGEFVMGDAKLIEPYYYRFSNFQNWFTSDRTDPFVYVGCHYVDLVWFITGIRPVEVSVVGVKKAFPNGKVGYLWANGRVRYENGALLSVTDGLGYPDEGSGSNEQGLTMFCEGDGKTGMIKHDDQFRGVTLCYLEGLGPGGTKHNYVNPDFFQLVPWEGAGYKPVGYGFDSVAAIINAIGLMEGEVAGLSDTDALQRQREILKETDDRGIIATPGNSYINELVVEAARLSITHKGDAVRIVYGDSPQVELGHAQYQGESDAVV
jgi:D-galacturonate reductase